MARPEETQSMKLLLAPLRRFSIRLRMHGAIAMVRARIAAAGCDDGARQFVACLVGQWWGNTPAPVW